jgi:hypothetical protein
MSENGFWLEEGEVIEKCDNGSLWHVSERLFDVDNNRHKYRLWDDTHTRDEYWTQQDLQDCFKRCDVIVTHSIKPRQRLDGRLYDES